MSYVNFSTVLRDFLIDFVSLYFFSYAILYKKYRNKELFVTVSLFNVFLMVIIMAMVRTNFNIAIGFGLFALLSMVTLRSAPFTKAEMAYLFGGVSLAVINGAGISNLTFVIVCNLAIISAAFVISSWAIEHSAFIIGVDNARNMEVILDHIDDEISNYQVMKDKLSEALKLKVIDFEVRSIDYVKDTATIGLIHEISKDEALQLATDEDLDTPRKYSRNANSTHNGNI